MDRHFHHSSLAGEVALLPQRLPYDRFNLLGPSRNKRSCHRGGRLQLLHYPTWVAAGYPELIVCFQPGTSNSCRVTSHLRPFSGICAHTAFYGDLVLPDLAPTALVKVPLRTPRFPGAQLTFRHILLIRLTAGEDEPIRWLVRHCSRSLPTPYSRTLHLNGRD